MNAMVLAAGLGTRMRPITDTTPKPLVPVSGRPLLDYALTALERAGAACAVVNVHHLADQIEAYVTRREGIRTLISDERVDLLDSGGGVVKALPLLGGGPFFILNADTFWLEGAAPGPSILARLAAAFDPARMDMMLLVVAPGRATGHSGPGDFVVAADGRLARFDGTVGAPMIYAGAIVAVAAAFADMPDGPFSLNRCFDAAIDRGRLYGLPLDGQWFTVGTVEAIAEVEAAMDRWARQAG